LIPVVTRNFYFIGNICFQTSIQWWSSFPSICPVIHPSKFLIPEEEDDGRRGGGAQMVAAVVYYNKIILKEN
jgi:hypothetical protein